MCFMFLKVIIFVKIVCEENVLVWPTKQSTLFFVQAFLKMLGTRYECRGQKYQVTSEMVKNEGSANSTGSRLAGSNANHNPS